MDFTVKSESDRLAVVSYISRLPSDKAFAIEVKPLVEKPKRSIKQNDLYWRWLRIIAKETGNDIDLLHKVFCKKFLGYDVAEVMGEKIAVARGTSKLKVDEMSDYLTNVEAFAATELNIVLPHIDELTTDE